MKEWEPVPRNCNEEIIICLINVGGCEGYWGNAALNNRRPPDKGGKNKEPPVWHGE